MAERGRFITLEGGEGAGKSTLAKALVAQLEADGHSVVLTREPGGTPPSEAIRNLLLNPDGDFSWSPLSEALLFNAARWEHLERLIRPSLAAGSWVICDRFADSTAAYQLASGAEIGAAVAALETMVVVDTSPDLTFVLDLPLEIGRERMAARGLAADAFEKRDEDFHARVRAAFLDIARDAPDRCVVLDATRSSEELAALALESIAERLTRAPS